jgi:hypothetical protein
MTERNVLVPEGAGKTNRRRTNILRWWDRARLKRDAEHFGSEKPKCSAV